ncbi:MAG: sulfatase-like hydrolase/transferase [Thermoplasmatota archaeon]
MVNTNDQKQLVKRLDWDYLIVLDACRFDYFKENCDFEGDLCRVKSPAFERAKENIAPTSVWYINIFEDMYEDVHHVSSHPRVNSRTPVEGFKGWEHFGKVYDLWDTEWDEEYGTVKPEDVTEKSRKYISENPDKKFIIHYMQPHTPYLSLDPPETKKKREPESRTSFWRKLRNKMVATARKVIGDEVAVKLMRLLRLPPLSPMDDALRKVGGDGVKKAYRDNLRIVLDSLNTLLPELSGRIVITADHGELLGEKGRYGHDFEAQEKLVEVPWFVIEK